MGKHLGDDDGVGDVVGDLANDYEVERCKGVQGGERESSGLSILIRCFGGC